MSQRILTESQNWANESRTFVSHFRTFSTKKCWVLVIQAIYMALIYLMRPWTSSNAENFETSRVNYISKISKNDPIQHIYVKWLTTPPKLVLFLEIKIFLMWGENELDKSFLKIPFLNVQFWGRKWVLVGKIHF